MRTIILLLAALATTFANAAEAGDTIVVEHAKKVTVVNNDSLLKISIDGTDSLPHYRYEASLQNVDSNYVSTSTLDNDFAFSFGGKYVKNSDGKEPKNSSELHFLLGFNGATGSNGLVKTSLGQSMEIGFWFDFGVRPWRDANRFSFGVGLDWRNFRMTGRRQFVKSADGSVSVEPLPQGADPKFSRIKEMSFLFPLMYSYSRHGWGFSLGPVINYTTHANILTRYRLDGEKQRSKSSDIHQNKVTVDIMATFISPVVDVYVKYSPCNILDTEYGPRFHAISFGIML